MVVVAALDVGSAGRTGWWRDSLNEPPTQGHNVDDLCDGPRERSDRRAFCALGFEAPQWVPFAGEATELGRARPNERQAWSAGAGATVLAYAIQQATYVLHRIALGTGDSRPVATLNPSELLDGTARLLVWEAFVSGRAKDRASLDPHVSDARAAAQYTRRWKDGDLRSDLGPTQSISLAGLALLVAELSRDPSILRSAPIVVRAPDLP